MRSNNQIIPANSTVVASKPEQESQDLVQLKKYRENMDIFNGPQGEPRDLYKACRHLFNAALMGNILAEFEMKKFPRNKKIMQYEYSSIILQEYMDRLEKIPVDSELYKEVQKELYILYFNFNHEKVYSSHKKRLDDICRALVHHTNTPDNGTGSFTRYSKYIKDLASATIIDEMFGKNNVIQKSKKYCFPFRIQPVNALKEEFLKLYPNKIRDLYSLLMDYQNLKNQYVLTKIVEPTHKKFKLELNLAEIETLGDRFICFYNKLKGEIARVTYIKGEIKVDIANYDVEIVLSGSSKADFLTFINPGLSIELTGVLVLERTLFISAEAETLNILAKFVNHKDNNAALTIEARNEINFIKKFDEEGKPLISNIDLQKSFDVLAAKATFEGCFYVKDTLTLRIKNSLTIAHDCEMAGDAELKISANAIPEMRGKLSFFKSIEFYLNDTAYFHGKSLVCSNNVILKARQVLITDTSSFVAAGKLDVAIREDLTIDGETRFVVDECEIRALNIKNYTPNFKGDKVFFRCKDTFTNFSTGVITTSTSFVVEGWHCWNGGTINFGKNMKLKLNGMFVHGVANLSINDLMHAPLRSGMTGENLSVVAGVVFNALGVVNTSRFNLTAVIEAGPSFSITKSMKKTRLFYVDLSVNLPNLNPANLNPVNIYRDLSEFAGDLYHRRLPRDSAITGAINFFSLARWIMDIILPGAIKPIDAAWTIVMALLTFPSICSQLWQLKEKWQAGANVEPSDIYELLGTTGTLAMLGINIYNQIENISANDCDFTIKFDSDKAYAVFLSFASVILPTDIEDGALGFRGGFHLGGSIMTRSGISYDLSLDAGLNISYLFTAAKQLDLAVGYNISHTGMKLEDHGMQVSYNNIINVSEEKDSATIIANNETHLGKTLVKSGVSHVKHEIIRESEKLTETKDSETTAESIDARAKNIELHGHIHGTAKHETLPEDKSAEAKDSGTDKNTPAPAAKEADKAAATPEAKDPAAPPAEEKPKNELKPDICYVASENLDECKDSVIDAPGSTVVMVGEHTTIEGTAHAENLLNQGKTFLDVKDDANQTGSKSLVLKGAAGSLKGHVSADALILDIDHGLIVKDVFNHNNGYENYKPTSYLSITTQDPTYLGDHWFDLMAQMLHIETEYSFPYSVHIDSPNGLLFYGCKLSTDGSFIFSGDAGVATMYTDITAKDNIYIQSATGFGNYSGKLSADTFSVTGGQVFNAGILQANTYLQIIANRQITPIYDSALSAGIGNYQGHMIGGTGYGHNGVGLYMKTAGNLFNQDGSIYCPSDAYIEAGTGVTNQSGELISQMEEDIPYTTISLNSAGLHASITAKGKEIIIANSGDIFNTKTSLISADQLSLQDKNGNIINWAGVIQAQTYLEAVANGDVINKCYDTILVGRWSIIQRFEPGYMFGGSGIGQDNGIGLFVSAGGLVLNDGSIFSSYGSNYFSGTHGIEGYARHCRYISYHHFDSESETTVWSNLVQPAMFISSHGSNTFYSSAGDINFMSVMALAGVNNEFSAHNTRLHSLVLEDITESSSSSFFGLENSYMRQQDEYVVPTTVKNINYIIFISSEGCVEIINTLLVNSGQLSVKAHDLLISATVLNHWLEMESSGFSVNLPIMSANNISPLLSDYKNSMNSQSALELGLNGWSMAFDGINSLNGVISGLRNNNLAQTFSPASYLTSADLSFGRSRMEAHWQSIPTNIGVYTGSANLQLTNAITFGNAVPIYVAGDAVIRAHIFNQYGAELHSTIETESQSFTLGMSLQGGFNFGESASGSTTNATHYQHQIFNVGGTLDIGVDEWRMEDANLIASILNAHVGNLTIVSNLDTVSSHSWSESLNTNGSFSFGSSSSSSGTIGMPSGIYTTHGMYLKADVITLEGGKIISHGPSYISANVINSIPVREYRRGSSFGISGNLHDFYTDPKVAWQQAIPSISVNIGSENYQADQNGTIWNDQGVHVQARTINGDLNQANPDGLRVIQDDHFNVNLKVPIYNPAGIHQLMDNMRWLKDSASAAPLTGPNKRITSDDLYDGDDEDYFDSDLPPLEEQKAEHKPEHKPEHKSEHKEEHNAEHKPEHTQAHRIAPVTSDAKNDAVADIGLDINHVDVSNMKAIAHADDEKKAEPSRRPQTGYSNLNDKSTSERLAGVALRGQGTSSTRQVFDRVNNPVPSVNEDKEDFLPLRTNDVRRVNTTVPGVREYRAGYGSMNDSQYGTGNGNHGLFRTQPASSPTLNVGNSQATAANDSSLEGTFNNAVRAMGESKAVAAINRVGDGFRSSVFNGINQAGESRVVAAINKAGDALNEAVVAPMFNALEEAFVTPAINDVNNARVQFANGEYGPALGSGVGVVVACAQFIPAGEGIALVESLGAQVDRFGIFGQRLSRVESSAYEFKPGQDVVHFNKHYEHITSKFGLENYTIEEYINDANLVIKNGEYVPELHAYVTITGGTGEARALFVGLDRQTNQITTMHLRKIADLEKLAPSLGWAYRTSIEPRDLIGPNERLGYKPPYRRN